MSRSGSTNPLLLPLGLALAVAVLAVPTLSFAQAPTFNALITTPKGGEPWFQPGSAAVGDFNQDGKVDALISDSGPNLRLMLGNGNGTFNQSNVSVPGTNPGSIKAGDLNGDGRLDAVTVSNGGNFAVTVLLNTGNAASGVPQFSVSHYFTGLNQTRSITIGDLNGDGSPDLVAGNALSYVVVFLNNGGGTFTKGQVTNLLPGAGGPSVGPGAIGDLNGDGRADYVVASNQNHASNVFFGNGNGTLQPPVVIPSFGAFLAVADVNNDGKPDLIEVDPGSSDPSSGKLMVFLNSGDGKFSSSPALYASGLAQPFSVTTADLDGDGNLDAVLSNFNNGSGKQVAVLLGDGNGGFGAPNLYLVNFGPLDVAVNDFNGDGKLDIATVGYQDRTYGVLLNNTVPPSCDAGSYLSGGACTLAPAGSYSPGGTATSPTPCAAGTYSATEGASACTPAPAGSFVASTGATSATACSAGSYSDTPGSVACTAAAPGTFVASAGATEATLCAAGSYSDTAGSTACTPAPAGSYVPDAGATAPTACAAGYSSNEGATSCFVVDSDGDGVKDTADAYPNSNLSATVGLGACATGVPNRVLENGASFNDLLGTTVAGAPNHGARVSSVTHLSNSWKAVGLISGRDHGAIVSCVARAK